MKHLLTIFTLLFCTTISIAQSYPTMITVEGCTFTMGDTEMEGEKDASSKSGCGFLVVLYQ